LDLALNGLVAVVTGGTSGIGLAAAEVLLAEGASVAICSRTQTRVDAESGRLRGRYDARVFGMAADVRDAEAIASFRRSVIDCFGHVDILVHSAGESRMANFAATDEAAWRDEIDLKFFGFINPTRAFLPDLRSSKNASIVYVCALLAVQPEPRLAATSATRAGVLNLAKSLSLELAPERIRVNSILLGVVDSGQWERRWRAERDGGNDVSREAYMERLARERAVPLGRLGTAQEIARSIAFLASPASSYTTGATLELSGGLSRSV
jgi:NAD(P)-dependent dehydrogenase (short-subunit alcohol dehydrogenase family)